MSERELEVQEPTTYELRRAQAELQAARDQYFDQAPVGYLTLDVSGTVLEANARSAALLEVDKGALVGSPLGTHLLAEGPVLAAHLREVFGSDSTRVCELAVRTRDGQRRSLRAESVAVVGAEGQPRHCRTVLVDVTAIVEADQKRRQLEETLRRREEELIHL